LEDRQAQRFEVRLLSHQDPLTPPTLGCQLRRMSRAVRRSSLVCIACTAALVLAACDEDQRSPERTIHRFLKAAASGDGKEVYLLLAPEAQQQLRQLAQLATAQASGRPRFAPEDLLATTLTSPAHELGRAELVSVKGDRAQVRLFGPKGQHTEVWELRQVDGKWRVAIRGPSLGGVRP
jgi:hypothetical protein